MDVYFITISFIFQQYNYLNIKNIKIIKIKNSTLFIFIDPFFPLNFLVDSWIPRMVDAIFQSTFLALVMVFWLSIYHGVRQVSHYLTKIISLLNIKFQTLK